MLLTLLLGLPMWLTAPAYFVLGTVWTVIRFPYMLARQAKTYERWRNKLTGGKRLELVASETLRRKFEKTRKVQDGESDAFELNPEEFRRQRDIAIGPQPLRAMAFKFTLSIAFWPISILDAVLEGVWPLIVRCLRAVKRVLSNLGTYFVRAVRAVWRFGRQLVTWLWQGVLLPVASWVHRRMQSLYRRIILKANREAIADLAMLEQADKKEEQV